MQTECILQKINGYKCSYSKLRVYAGSAYRLGADIRMSNLYLKWRNSSGFKIRTSFVEMNECSRLIEFQSNRFFLSKISIAFQSRKIWSRENKISLNQPKGKQFKPWFTERRVREWRSKQKVTNQDILTSTSRMLMLFGTINTQESSTQYDENQREFHFIVYRTKKSC